MHARSGLPVIQRHDRPDVIDLSWGHPGPDLLPVELLRGAFDQAIRRYGTEALSYGADAGPGPFLDWLAHRLGTVDGRAPLPSELLVTAGASHALDLVCGLLAEPGDVCLVPTPTYHLALAIIRDHGLAIEAVACDSEGVLVESVTEALSSLRREGRRPRLLYLVPTFGNPSGITLSVERRRQLADRCSSAGVLIVEDDVYRELAFDAPAPASIWALASPGSVVRLGSFSKTLAPGLRLGFLSAAAGTVAHIAAGGLLDSGGGIGHLPALAVAELGASGAYDANLATLRAELGARRDALVAGLREHVPEGTFRHPGGGYFLWLRLPSGVRAADVLARAERHGVGALPGEVFAAGASSHSDVLRLSFSMYPPRQLVEAARRMGAAISDAIGATLSG
jgi:2-aminoadipate transaminase